LRVLRGGSFVSQRLYARAAVRGDSFTDSIGAVTGFRVALMTGKE
jgi:formylglycine-generating enzyme required for sulfatase activity